jgi:CSLREA domain-containing protein
MAFFRRPKSVRRPCSTLNRLRYRARLEILESRLAPAVITVTTTADDNVTNDASVSLREAIEAINDGTAGADTDISNQNPGVFGANDTINFGIPAGSTVQTIHVGASGNGALPELLKPMTINGYSAPASSPNTLANSDNAKILIELDGTSAGTNADGLLVDITGAGSTIEGLAINRFSKNGIELQGGGDTIAGNFVGTDPLGGTALANQQDGIHISNSSGSTIGGTAPGARNIVSGNEVGGIHIVGTTATPATGNQIEGNFVGVSASGTGSVGIRGGALEGNGVFGIQISGGNANTIGGSTLAARNVVSLNIYGIELDNGAQNNIVQGNYVGVGADGLANYGNLQVGILLRSGDLLGTGQPNEPPVSGNIIGLNPKTGFSGLFNLVEYNGAAGIAISANPLPNNATPLQNSGNSILGNSVFENGRNSEVPVAGIDLGNDGPTANDSKGHGAAGDPNNFQNFPVLTSAAASVGHVTIGGTLDQVSSPHTQYRIEFFASQPVPDYLSDFVPQGQSFLGAANVTSDGSGHASFNVSLPTSLSGPYVITATATNLTPDPSAQPGAVNVFNTSEFSAGIPSTILMAFAADSGSSPMVAVWNHSQFGSSQVGRFDAFDQAFRGGVRVAMGDVNGDGVADVIVAAGPGGGPHVKVIDGTKLSWVDANGEIRDDALLGQFYAFDPLFSGGVFVAVGSLNGHAEIITGAGAGGGPHVKVIDPRALSLLQRNGEIADTAVTAQFYAYSPLFLGGVTVAAADLNGDGIVDIVTGAGPGGGPHVKVIDGTRPGQLHGNAEIADGALIGQFYAGPQLDTDGVFVAADSNNGHPIVVTSHAIGSGPVQVIDATRLDMLGSDSEPTGAAILGSFFAYDPHDLTMGTSAHVAILDFNGDGVADVLVGPSQTRAPEPVEVVDGTKLNDVGLYQQILPSALLLDDFFIFGTDFTGGIFVGGE